MSNDLARHIESCSLIDTHEHLSREEPYLDERPDVLRALFQNYVSADLACAGASPEAIKRLFDQSDPDLAGRFNGVQDAWALCRHTGYGQAVELMARHVFEIDRIDAATVVQAQKRQEQLLQPGERLRLLEQVANLDHVQTDDGRRPCEPDDSGLDFFLYDLSWREFVTAEFKAADIYDEVGIEITGIESLRDAIAAIFVRFAPTAISVKTQHAYFRTLRWQARTDDEAAAVLSKQLGGRALDETEKLALGDWCLARGVEQAIEHNLPIKIHTGYYAGNNYMVTERIPAGHLCPLLSAYPAARFVLMHMAYPYNDELVALTKHYANVWVDLCWAWCVSPYTAGDFVRRLISAAPANKLFAFGGDCNWPTAAVAYSIQARQGLTRALRAAVDDGDLTEREAIELATRFMQTNQRGCFDIDSTRTAIHEAAAVEA